MHILQGVKTLILQTPAQLASHLRSLRKTRGLTQAALGRLIGLDQTRIAKIERMGRVAWADSMEAVVVSERHRSAGHRIPPFSHAPCGYAGRAPPSERFRLIYDDHSAS